jgi:hypothetical protein
LQRCEFRLGIAEFGRLSSQDGKQGSNHFTKHSFPVARRETFGVRLSYGAALSSSPAACLGQPRFRPGQASDNASGEVPLGPEPDLL